MALTPQQIDFLERYVLRRRLVQLRDAGPPAPDAQQDRQRTASDLLDLAAAIEVPQGATPDERGQIIQGRGAISGLLTETATEKELRAAAQMMLDLQATNERIKAAVEARVTAARLHRENECRILLSVVQDLLKTVDRQIPENARNLLLTRGEKLEKALPGVISDDQLAENRKAVDDLRDAIQTANHQALEARQKRILRAAELAKDASDVKVDNASPEERLLIERLAGDVSATLPIDRNQTTDDNLNDAESALQILRDEAGKIADAVLVRVNRVEKAGKLLDSVKFGEGALKTADGAPSGKVDPLRQRAEAIPVDHASLRDLGKAHERGNEGLDLLVSKIDALKKDVADLNDAVAKALEDIHRAAQSAETAITSSPGAKLSPAQQGTLRNLITPEVETAEKDTDKGPEAIKALAKIAKRATDLAKALGLLDDRILRVNGAPADALPSELKTLTAARKAADEAIAKVDP